MKMKRRLRQITFSAALVILAGCASQSGKSSHGGVAGAKRSSAIKVVLQPLPNPILEQAATNSSAPLEGEGWQPMFDGKTLTGWRETEFAGRGEAQCRTGLMLLNMGDPFTGINWTNEF